MRLVRVCLAAALGVATLAVSAPAGAEDDSWWLNVFFNVEGIWRPGHEIDGWAAREYETAEECAARKAFAEAECRANPLDYPARWFCSPGEPMDEPPEQMRGILCMAD